MSYRNNTYCQDKIKRSLFFLYLALVCNLTIYSNNNPDKKSILLDYSPFIPSSSHIFTQGIWLNKSYTSIGIENRYCLAELTDKMVCHGFRLRKDLFLFRLSHFGYSKIGCLDASFGYCREISEKFAMGLRFHYLLDHAYQYRSTHSFTVEASASLWVNNNVQIGFAVYNPIMLKYGIIGEQLIPITFKLHASYKIGKRTLLWCYLQKSQPGGFFCNAGTNLEIKNTMLSLGAGNRSCFLAFSIIYKKIIFQFRSEYSFRLGYSPVLHAHLLY
ncbi:hypothetical protein LJC68_05990 [Bacteroidales bacterium OttesenSCG-928-B11]|nr:hypothetical protein [Bacteroidales bacterium OttesenSCG-928-E04]MDL2312409.1 hypothetical protein [Bacteroidales bacterium OttesenSCG-928-B11]MDL2326312.1 hypothetical protein [Bacteroidales bacterium OttesenSCG-928-A14]